MLLLQVLPINLIKIRAQWVSTFFEIQAQTKPEGESGKGAGRQTASMCVKRYALKTAGLREKVGEIYVIKGGSDRKR